MEIIATTKITNRDGIKAIKNGQKSNKYADIPTSKKPSWLKIKAEFNSDNLIISFNSKYLLDIASEVENKNLKLNLKDSISPVLRFKCNLSSFVSIKFFVSIIGRILFPADKP